jgi:hypothetical protein
MRYFIKRLLIFLIPVAAYVLLVVFIDPFNYLSISKNTVNEELKKSISNGISNPLYELVGFQKQASPYVLLGSSQTGLLNPTLIKQYSPHTFVNMAYGGGSLPETMATFWELTKQTKLKEVYIGISFIDFNGSQYRNRIPEALKIKANFLSYVFSKATLKSTLLILKSIILNTKIEIGKPDMSEEKFWQFQLDETANRFYQNHTYPIKYYQSLQAIAAYCNQNNIKLVLFIPPSHVELQKKVAEFHFEQEENKFKEDLKKLGDVYDFNYPNTITNNRNNFSDPFHVTADVAKNMAEVLFAGSTNNVIFYKCTNCPVKK